MCSTPAKWRGRPTASHLTTLFADSAAPGSIDGPGSLGDVERECRDLDIERLSRLRHHPIAPDHETRRGRQWHPARIFESLARFQHRLLPYDARPADLLQPALRIGYSPMPGL